MIIIMYISVMVFTFLTFVLLKFLKRDKKRIKEELHEEPEKIKSENIIKTDNDVEDNLEKEKEIDQIKLEQENSNKLIEYQAVSIPQANCLRIEREEIAFNTEKEEEKTLIEHEFEIIEEDEIPPNAHKEISLAKEIEFNPDDMLNRFVGYINRNKLAKIEDLNSRLKSGTNETVHKLREIEIQGNTMGFVDDKGFYMSLNERELDLLEKLLLASKLKNPQLNKQKLIDEFNDIVNPAK